MLLGNLGADPELRFTQSGQPLLSLRLATTESYLDKDKVRKERTDWHSVVVWGKRGESLAKILNKGSSIFVEGSMRTSTYDDREGNKRYKTEVIAHNILLTGGRRHGDEHGDEHGDGQSDHAGVGGAPYGSAQRSTAPAAQNQRSGGYNRGGGGPKTASRGDAATNGSHGGAPGGSPLPDDDFGGGFGGGSDDDIPFIFCEGVTNVDSIDGPEAVGRRPRWRI